MIIPYKYRDRYDMLARSHPWMREMRDEQAPEDDAVEELREFIDDQFVSGKTAWTQGMAIADMVERDYVRKDGIPVPDSRIHAECHELSERVDELEAMNEKLQVALDAVEGCDERCLKLEAERDEWKAKAEQCNPCGWWNSHMQYCERTDDDAHAKAEGSSNFVQLFNEDEWFAAMVRVSVAALMQQGEIDLDGKTIDEWLMSPHGMDGESDGNGTCPDANETASNISENLGQSQNSEIDSREKLEADVHRYANPTNCIGSLGACWEKKMIGFLDRQAAITEHELADGCADCAVKRANRVLSQSVDRLTRERDALAVDLADAMAPHAVDMRVKLDEGARLPERAHPTDAGADLFAPHDIVIPARGSATVDTGVHVQIPGGCCGLLVSKSGLNVKLGIESTGLIDEGYSGSVAVKLYNHSDEHVKLPNGSKISQLVVLPALYPRIVQADEIASGERGSNGFGSTDAPLTLVDGDGEVV